MNRVLSSAALLGLFLISAAAQGADWKSIAKERSDDPEVLVDTESIERVSEDVVKARVKYSYSKPRSFDSKYIRELVVCNEYHCKERKCRILWSEGHFTDGTQEADASEREGHILPGDAVYEYLCK